ncbi:MAG: hypothetical protein K2K36_06585 [Muribaculaceae bacterium]|nr:hypothetical protein [Muribaculaceae bacterium]
MNHTTPTTSLPELPQGPQWDALLAENARRLSLERAQPVPDPTTGFSCTGPRIEVLPRLATGWQKEWVPRSMAEEPGFGSVESPLEWQRIRCRHDFEFWAATCVKIKNKTSAHMVPFVLNRPQRRVLAELERMRLARRPIRMIMLKARQWGGSTLVQMYMAWMQCTRLRNWHSLICAQVGKTAASIRGMYDAMLASYPTELWDGEGAAPRLTRFQSQDLIREIAGRSCRITLGSSESQDAVRGADYAMAHLSEVAFWKDTPKSTPAEFIRSVCGAIALEPDTLVVMESTANGVGNYFHTEWLRSQRGESDKAAVFVPWYEIDIYRMKRPDYAAVWSAMDSYERALWSGLGLTLERIAWYQCRRREYADHSAMMAEFPTTAEEAFTNSGTNVFPQAGVTALRAGCVLDPAVGELASASGAVAGPGALKGLEFRPDSAGCLKVWEMPRRGARYVAAVDVGGRSRTSDWSVVAVIRVDRTPEVVAQWRGHTDHDLLTWKAAAIGRFYNRARLVFESNTLESDISPDQDADSGADQGAYILHELFRHYPELYYRMAPDGGTPRPGFHTNRATKQMIVTELVAAVRDASYTERDPMACDELTVYARRPNGSYGARAGFHDDILMTRAIGLHVVREELECFDPELPDELDLPIAEPDDDLSEFCAPWR